MHAIGNWLYHYTGSQGSGPWYGFYSGFGANFGELLVFGAVLAFYRQHKCASCFRIGVHKLPDTGQRTCHWHSTVAHHELLRALHKQKHPDHIAHVPPPPPVEAAPVEAAPAPVKAVAKKAVPAKKAAARKPTSAS